MHSVEQDPASEIIPCVWAGAVVRLPLFHDAFTLLDLLAWGQVKLSLSGGSLHKFIDKDGLINYNDKFFTEDRSANIDHLCQEFPSINSDQVRDTFIKAEEDYMRAVGLAMTKRTPSDSKVIASATL